MRTKDKRDGAFQAWHEMLRRELNRLLCSFLSTTCIDWQQCYNPRRRTGKGRCQLYSFILCHECMEFKDGHTVSCTGGYSNVSCHFCNSGACKILEIISSKTNTLQWITSGMLVESWGQLFPKKIAFYPSEFHYYIDAVRRHFNI